MIIYNPAYDINHCAFRLISLLLDVKDNQLEWDKLKILDFYYLFPHFMHDKQLPRNKVASKAVLKKMSKPYETLPEPKRLFFSLKNIHNETVHALVGKQIFDKDSFTKNLIQLGKERVPDLLIRQIEQSQRRKTNWYRLITEVLSKQPLKGKTGLKARTNLMEFRYDG